MKKKFVYVHISHLDDEVRVISVNSSLRNAMIRANNFMERHEYGDYYKFHAIEKWEINLGSENPDEVWEYDRTRDDKPKQWVKLEELERKVLGTRKKWRI